MKKIMIAASAAFCATVGFGEIASANVVGYTTVNNGGAAYITGGMCFVTPGGENFKLSDIKLSGSTWGTDKIQFIDPATSAIDLTKVYDYYGPNDGATADDEGWYYTGTNPDGDYVGDQALPQGTAFLASFYSPSVTVTFSGEVVDGATIDCTGKIYPCIANMYPGDIELNSVKLVGSTWGTDKIQFIDPATSAIDLTKVYDYYGPNDGATADDEGWYYTGTNPDGDYVGDEILKSGDAFLCSFYSPAVKVVFPSID